MESGSSIIFERIDLSQVFEKIKSAKTLGIQLPDGLKFYVNEIADLFRKKGFEIIFSGKPSYGACDIDIELLREVDFLLHFAHTKMVEIDRVVYVPYKIDYSVDVDFLKNRIRERRIALIGTASYAWKFDHLKEELEKAGFEIELKMGKGVEFKGQVLGCNYTCLANSNADGILFIGDGEFHALGAAIHSKQKVYAYSPLSKEFISVSPEKFIKKRYLAISKAMTCESFGILVSTKIGQKRLELARKLQKIAAGIGKTAEIILSDEITPEIMSNFRFEMFVNTACPRITFDDYSKFNGKLITPKEFEIALAVKDFSEYRFEFE